MKRRSGFYGIPPPRMIMSTPSIKRELTSKVFEHIGRKGIDIMMRIQYIQYRHFRFDIFCLFYELSYFRILYNILQNVLVYFCIFGSYSSLDEVWVFTHGILQKVNWCKDNTLWTKIKNASSLLHCTVLKSKCLYLVRNNRVSSNCRLSVHVTFSPCNNTANSPDSILHLKIVMSPESLKWSIAIINLRPSSCVVL